MLNDCVRVRATLFDEIDTAVLPRLLAFLRTRGLAETEIPLIAADMCWRGVTTAEAVYRDDLGGWWIARASNDFAGEGRVAPNADEWGGYAEEVTAGDAVLQVAAWITAMA